MTDQPCVFCGSTERVAIIALSRDVTEAQCASCREVLLSIAVALPAALLDRATRIVRKDAA